MTTDWLAEHLDGPGLVVAEVDENPDLYEEGHIPGAVKLHWKDDLQDPLVRDVVSNAGVRASDGRARNRKRHDGRALRGQEQLVRRLRVLVPEGFGHEDVRLLDGGRQKWIEEGRELTTASGAPTADRVHRQDRDESIRIRRDEVLAGLADTPSRSSTFAARRSSRAS